MARSRNTKPGCWIPQGNSPPAPPPDAVSCPGLKILFGLLSAWRNQEVALGSAHIHAFKNILSFSGRGSRWGLRLEAVRSDTKSPWEPWAVLPEASETEPDKMKKQRN